jgi:DNA polymerase III subunit chi
MMTTPMQVDFYQLTRDPAHIVLPAIANKVLEEGRRLLIVSGDMGQLKTISSSLWGWKAESFLAHSRAGQGDEADQPILLAETTEAANGARLVALADGEWRGELLEMDVDRVFYLFPPQNTNQAREAWKALKDKEGVERRYWKQDGGKWRQGP